MKVATQMEYGALESKSFVLVKVRGTVIDYNDCQIHWHLNIYL